MRHAVTLLGQRSSVVYNAAGQVTGQINPLGQRSTFTYTSQGPVAAVINPLNQRTTNLYLCKGSTGNYSGIEDFRGCRPVFLAL